MKLLLHPLVLLAVTVLILFGVLRSYTPPDPLPADAPAEEFSAGRAEAVLRDLLQDIGPHVSGSAENAMVRDRVIAQFEAAGYPAKVQGRYHCNPMFGVCSPVQNIIAVRKGTAGEDAILLTAHYDSVWAGPGAADDGAGTAAVLEIARMMAAQPDPLNDIIFLITDAEEQGLIGAHAFAELHPLFAKVRLVINLEARGVGGASTMFETGEGNRRLIRRFAEMLDRPVANSLMYEVYKRMPNDTDYSVYKQRGVAGLNFAFAQGVAVYHSRIDDPDHLDMGSLQHHGDNAWALVKALGSTEMKRLQSREDAGYVDLFAMKLLHYPVSIESGLTLVLVVLLLFGIVFFHSRDMHFGRMFWSICSVVFLLVTIPVGAWLLSWPLGGWLDMHPLEHPQPWVGRLVLFLEVFLCLWLAIRLFAHRTSRCGLLLVSWLCFGILALMLSYRVPTAGYIAMIPLVAFTLGMIIDLLRVRRGDCMLFAALFGFAGAAYMAFYHFFMLDVVLNFDRSHIKVLPLLMIAVAVLPLIADWWGEDDEEGEGKVKSWMPARIMLVVIFAGALLHSFLPGFTADRPRPMNLVYQEVAGAGDALLYLESPYGIQDEDFAGDSGFEQMEITAPGRSDRQAPAMRVPYLDLPGISTLVGPAELMEDGGRRYLISLLPPDGLEQLTVLIDEKAGLRSARLNGEPALDTSIESKHNRPVRALRFLRPGTRTLQLELVTDGAGLADLTAVSRYPLPDNLAQPYLENWPADSQPSMSGPRALKYEVIALPK